MKIYYAHPMSWYGTDRETEDLKAIAHKFPNAEIENPAAYEDAVKTLKTQGADGKAIMDFFINRLLVCDAIAYRTFDDDYIGAGVALEVFTAAVWGKQIFRLLDQISRFDDLVPGLLGQLGLRAAFGPRVLTIADTRDRIKRGVM